MLLKLTVLILLLGVGFRCLEEFSFPDAFNFRQYNAALIALGL